MKRDDAPSPRQRKPKTSLRTRLRTVRLLLCDVDGVLTDGTVWMGRDSESKRFHIRDGLGLKILMKHGMQVGWVSRRPSPATQRRAEDLKIKHLIQHDGGKVAGVESILKKTGLNWSQVCYVGDDIVDLAVLRRAGVAIAVSDAVPEARLAADYVTRAPGGHGAVREIVEMLLKAQNKWQRVVDEYAC
jgi:3-deoxy-D-manno-octulosonate 8-phosphate phosphatase (KDO 8-P phosphatase)